MLVGLAMGVVATIVFAKLLDSIRENDSVVRLDHSITSWFVARRTDANVSVMRAVTRLADTWTVAVVVAAAVGVLLAKRHRGEALFVAASSAGAALLVAIAKLAVGRSRPPAIEALVMADGYAFPSGHATQSIACYSGLAIVAWNLTGSRRLRTTIVLGAAVIALAVGLSRVWLGVHWVSDVVAGWALAGSWLGLLVTARHMIARARLLRRRTAEPE